MARKSGGSHKCVDEKRRMLPIYHHYTLSPGRTKSHHPEAKCNHCSKEFVCGSKQRLIRHLRKCNSITNPDQIIAETLNTLARNSATGQLNHSILEASNLLPSQISQIHQSATQQLVGHTIQQQHYQTNSQHLPNNHSSTTSSSTITTANNHITSNNNVNSSVNNSNVNGTICHDTSGSSLSNNDSLIVANSGNSSTIATINSIIPVKKTRRGRRPANQHNVGSGIHVTTGLDGKTHFTPISQLPPGMVSSSPQLIANIHNGTIRGAYSAIHQTTGSGASSVAPNAATVVQTGANLNSGHHIHVTPFKLNSEPIDRAYLKLVLTRSLPITLCDTKEFHNWVKTFANDYKPPSSINLIAQNLKQEAQLARQRVSNILVKASKKTVNLELQCWPDQLRGRLWYAVIAALDSRRFLISIKDVLDRSSANNNQLMNNRSNCQLTASEVDLQSTDCKTLTEFLDDCIRRVGSDRVNSLMFTGKMITEPTIVTRAREALYSNHSSVVTYYCWWHFTNLLCSDIFENDEISPSLMRNSKLLIDCILKRPQIYSKLERFSPFAGTVGSLSLKKDDPRWCSHLLCYLLEFIKNNHEAILKALDAYIVVASDRSLSASDNNNNNPRNGANDQHTGNVQHISNSNQQSTQQQPKPSFSQREQSQLIEVRSIVASTDYWTNLNSALVYMKPFRDIVALIPTPTFHNDPDASESNIRTTPAISTTISNHLSLSEYMNWFLNYGKSLFDCWRQAADRCKYDLVGHYIRRFNAAIEDFKLLFAAYLLNPKYRCAFVTQKAKDLAIEEILNIASEFMPEESDGHTIFDQWKLYLVREEPYDMVFDESRTNALDWWMSIPCAESIRRVAIRILRLKAFSSPRPESLFFQLYYYEDETKASLSTTSFEDLAILRYFYDHEDRLSTANTAYGCVGASNLLPHNGVSDRSQIGQAHNDQLHDANDPAKYLPSGFLDSTSSGASNGQFANESLSINESGELRIFTDAVDSYMDATRIVDHLNPANTTFSSLDNLPGFDQFTMYIDFNESGIHIVEEPIEKKRRKWTAQEILSRCQSSHNNSNGSTNNGGNAVANRLGDK